uniref:Transposase (Putative), gypsy type n=1 Tax=Tanacetum cinerariifolium TaxID=118510 RepID=A0A699I6S4_TANCI|nr:hypothetical protein [Tanacetum cinerariifolium]
MLLFLVRISRRYYLGDEVYPTFLHDDDRDMDMFNLIRAPNPTKVKIRSCPRAAHEVPLLTMTANRVIEMEDPAAATDSSEVPPPEDVPATSAPEAGQVEEVAVTDPSPEYPWGEEFAVIELGIASTRLIHVPESAPAGVSDPDPLSFADPRSRHPADVTQSSQCTATTGDPESENASFAFAVGSPESIYRPEWGVANGSMLDTPEACQALWTMSLLRVAMGSQLRLRFEQEEKLLRKSVAQVARRDKRIQAGEHEIKNLEALLMAEADMKKATEDRNARLSQELEDMRALFSDLQVSNNRLSRQVAALQEQVSGEEKLKAAFEEFKRWLIGHELRLAVMKCGESLKLRQAFTYVVSAGIAKGMSDGLSRAKKKKKCRIVCRTHGVGSAHHARSDGVPVFVPTVISQGLAILLADAATQTDTD